MKILRFVCNSYLVNSYLLIADDDRAILIDAACNDQQEFEHLQEIIKKYNIRLTTVIMTHTHADHIMGIKQIMDNYPDVSFLIHREAEPLYTRANDYSMIMGFKKREFPSPTGYVTDGETLQVSDIALEILYTPGHAPGSICLYLRKENLLFSGDVLFRDSIGRTDLPGGSFDTLKKSIYEKLFTLPDDTTVFPGHGDNTTLGYEKTNNPFLR
jgi:glyoxylase-like metal-dependent hydrolase (beta-lactamase superfamily II)